MAFHSDAKRAPIISPFYLQWERYPYLRGPNYVRPMFREHSRGGAFRANPIERILPPAMSGLGSVPSKCWDTPGFKEAHQECFNLSQTYGKMFVSTDPKIDKSDLVHCSAGMTEKQCIDAAFSACRDAAVKRVDCQGGETTPGGGGGTTPGDGGAPPGGDLPEDGSKSSMFDFFKNKETGAIDPLKAGLAVLVVALVFRAYKKGSQ